MLPKQGCTRLAPGLAKVVTLQVNYCFNPNYVHVVVLASYASTQDWISEVYRVCCTYMQLSHGN